MPFRDPWGPDRDRERGRERDFDGDHERRRADFDRPQDDFGQADYSSDYGYDPRTRTGYRAYDDGVDRGDFGQADFSKDYAYDEHRREPYRRSDPEARRDHEGDWHYAEERHGDRRNWHFAEGRRADPRPDDGREDRSWFDQARDRVEGFFGGAAGASQADRAAREHRRDRVIWAVITGRLDHERRLDPRHIEVLVQGSEVTLNGTVRSRDEKRLAEDLADVRGVTHVQNNLRIHRSFWR
ncbi:MAG TPA: BON domain-containing protein [Caulobacteraceae bacterium]|nr:BON domain-containing protein [Caulobacteraceae bacterium]